MEEKENISISKEIAEKLKKRASESGFNSLEDYINYILKQVLSKVESKSLTKDDEEAVKQKLRSLGYL
jgi:hypothetical protein